MAAIMSVGLSTVPQAFYKTVTEEPFEYAPLMYVRPNDVTSKRLCAYQTGSVKGRISSIGLAVTRTAIIVILVIVALVVIALGIIVFVLLGGLWLLSCRRRRFGLLVSCCRCRRRMVRLLSMDARG